MQGKNRKFVLLSFDVEEFDTPLNYNQHIGLQEQLAVGHKGLMNLMELLGSEEQVTCTFFTTACFAENFSKTVREISISHEIASHTCSNSTFNKGELELSKNILESIIQKPVYGLRMPQMQEPDMEEVSRVPYAYDASINPCWLPGRYNNWGKPRTAFREKNVIRIPASVSANLRIPLFWLSFKKFPYPYFRYLARKALEKDGYLSLYFHPWEFTDIHEYQIPRYVKLPSDNLLLFRLDRLIRDLKKDADFISMYDFYTQIQL